MFKRLWTCRKTDCVMMMMMMTCGLCLENGHYLLTPRCRILLEQLFGLQLVKKFSAFHGTRRFITPLTSVRHLSLSWASPIQSHIPTSHLLEIHPNIIHPSTPRSPQWSLSPRFHDQDPIHPPLLTHTRHMPNPSHSSRFFSPAQYWVRGLENGHTERKQGNGHTERKQGFGMFLSLQPSSGVCILVVNAVAFRLIS